MAAAVADDAVDVVIDHLWGRPTEALIAAISRRGLTHGAPRVRLVEVGDSAAPTITLPAQVLRSSGLELYGSGAGTIPLEAIMAALPQFIDRAASGELRIGSSRSPSPRLRTPGGTISTAAGWSSSHRPGVDDPCWVLSG